MDNGLTPEEKKLARALDACAFADGKEFSALADRTRERARLFEPAKTRVRVDLGGGKKQLTADPASRAPAPPSKGLKR